MYSNVIIQNSANHNFQSSDYYCYLLKDPENNDVFYIGKGHRLRVRDHKYSYNSKNKHKNNKIKQILERSSAYIAEIVYTTPYEADAYLQEVKLIEQYSTKYKLTNMNIGGSEHLSKPCQPIKQYNLFGEYTQTFLSYNHAASAIDDSPHTASQILECCRGAIATARDFYWSYVDNPILRYRTKILPVLQYDSNFIYINRYVSAAEAGQILSLDGREILKSARNNWKCGGFKWKIHQFPKH